jgi:uncharacterized membrane protein YraQ (UPF0718 family)
MPVVQASRRGGGSKVVRGAHPERRGCAPYNRGVSTAPFGRDGITGSTRPALALLLAGPALSLPSMLAIRTIMGTKKTIMYIVLMVVMATITGLIYGTLF